MSFKIRPIFEQAKRCEQLLATSYKAGKFFFPSTHGRPMMICSRESWQECFHTETYNINGDPLLHTVWHNVANDPAHYVCYVLINSTQACDQSEQLKSPPPRPPKSAINAGSKKSLTPPTNRLFSAMDEDYNAESHQQDTSLSKHVNGKAQLPFPDVDLKINGRIKRNRLRRNYITNPLSLGIKIMRKREKTM